MRSSAESRGIFPTCSSPLYQSPIRVHQSTPNCPELSLQLLPQQHRDGRDFGALQRSRNVQPCPLQSFAGPQRPKRCLKDAKQSSSTRATFCEEAQRCRETVQACTSAPTRPCKRPFLQSKVHSLWWCIGYNSVAVSDCQKQPLGHYGNVSKSESRRIETSRFPSHSSHEFDRVYGYQLSVDKLVDQRRRLARTNRKLFAFHPWLSSLSQVGPGRLNDSFNYDESSRTAFVREDAEHLSLALPFTTAPFYNISIHRFTTFPYTTALVL